MQVKLKLQSRLVSIITAKCVSDCENVMVTISKESDDVAMIFLK